MYLRVYQILVGLILGFKRKEKHRNLLVYSLLRCYNSGERGIRTPGTSRYAGFQDRCNRPLYHLSERFREVLLFKSDAKVGLFIQTAKCFCKKMRFWA